MKQFQRHGNNTIVRKLGKVRGKTERLFACEPWKAKTTGISASHCA